MFLVFDIGGTSMRLAVGQDGDLLGEPVSVPTPKDFVEGLRIFAEQAGVLLHGEKPTRAAGGIAGPLDQAKSMVVSAPNLPDWVNKPLKSELSKILGTEVILENDTALGGLGESVWGAGRGSKIMAYLAIGTGVGGCRVVEQRIDTNTWGFEPGHQIISQNHRECLSLEQLVSGSALKTRYAWEQGSPVSEELQDELAWNLAVGLHNLTLFWSADTIVLGGGVMNAGAIPIAKVEQHLKQIMHTFSAIPRLEAAQLKDKAGLYGALRLITQDLLD